MFSFDSELYIQIWPTKLTITKVKTGEVFQEECVGPFERSRLIINDFEAAEKQLRQSVRKVYENSFAPPAPRMVIHPMDLPPDGISSIEIRAFRDLAVSAGAREVKVYTGLAIPIDDFDYKSIQSSDALAGSAIRKKATVILEAFFSVLFLFLFLFMYEMFTNYW